MSAISWNSGASGDWTTAANWSPAKVPGAGDAATIAFPGFYTVTVTAEAVKVGSITISNTSAALDIEAPGNTETVLGSIANSGRLLIDATDFGGTTLKIGGTLTNGGTFNIGNGAATATTKVNVGGLSNTGFGNITLTGGAVLTVAGSSINTSSTLLQVDSSGVGGSQLNVGGVLSENGFLTIGNSSLTRATTVTVAGLAGAGTIMMNEGIAATATLNVTGAAPVTLLGTYNLANNALIKFGSGGVSAIGNGASVTLNGPKALMALKSAPTSNSALTGLAQNAGILSLLNGAALATGALDNSNSLSVDTFGSNGGSSLAVNGVLTNESTLQIGNPSIIAATKVSAKSVSNFSSLAIVSDAAAASATLTVTGAFLNGRNASVQVDGSGAGGSVLTVGGVLTNNGSLTIGSPNLTKATTVKAAGLVSTGTGTITMNEGTFAPATATLNITGAAPATLLGGYNLAGNALIKFGSGGVSAIGNGAMVSLNGPKALIALNSAPTSNSALAKLTQNAGTLSLLNGAALATGALDNSGSLSVDTFGSNGGSSLKVGVFTNESTFQIGNPSITAATKVSATAVSNFGSLAIVSDPAAASATLTVSGAFLNGHSGSVGIDASGGSGGSSLTIGGVLTDNGSFTIGNSSLTRATKVKAGSLAVNSSLSIVGLAGAGTATLTTTGASSDVGTINISAGGVLALGNTLTVSGALNLNGGTVSGGTLATAGKGSMQAATSVVSTLSAVTIAAGSIFSVATGGTLVDSGVTVKGALVGNGGATLDFAKATTAASLSNISGFATIGLANTANVLTLAAANFAGTAGVITINDGSKGNTVTATALPAGDAITVHAGTGVDVLKGGAGNDILFAGGKTTMTGAKGANEFVFSAPGSSNTITDFANSAANDMLFVSGSGFSLPGATASAQPLGGLFTQNATGAFTAKTQRFAYDKTDGDLFYSGNGTTATEHLVTVVSGHPTLNPAHLLFST